MDESWNKQLKRQLWKHFKDQPIPEDLFPLLESISVSYDRQEKEHKLLERVMDLSSQELFNTNVELRKRNEELDRFVYSTSHDLRAPLTSILGLLQIIELSDNQKEIESYLANIKTITLQLDDFIQDIVVYTHNKKMKVELEQVNFRELTDGCIRKLDYMANAKLVRKDISIEENCTFYSDHQRLDNLLLNLISNSIKYCNTEQDDPFVSIAITTSEKEARIRIEDNGVGIKEEHVKRIFDMFFRASGNSKGSGIGLYIVKEIVEKLKGEISVTSSLGEGTTFEIALPNHQPA